MPSETGIVAHCNSNFRFAGLVRHVIQIAIGIGVLVIDGRRDYAFINGLAYRSRLDCTGRPKEMTGHGLSGTDLQTVLGMISENVFQGNGLRFVVVGGGSPMGIDLIDTRRLCFRNCKGLIHAMSKSLAFPVRGGYVKGVTGG